MKEEQDYIRDLAEIRSMMERSSKFLSLSGWAGIMAGTFALAGTWLAHDLLGFQPPAWKLTGNPGIPGIPEFWPMVALAVGILILSTIAAVYFSQRRSRSNGEKLWNPITKRLTTAMAVPLVSGGLLMLILLSQGLIGLLIPTALIFYGLAVYSASRYIQSEVRILGLVEILLGLLAAAWPQFGLYFWALGFGLAHIIYGIYMHYTYER